MNLFDLVARHQFFEHSNFNAVYDWLRCCAKGEICKVKKGHSRIYLPEEDCKLRTLELEKGIFRLIESSKGTPILGIKSQSIMTKLKNQNYLISTTPEPMHLISRILKKISDSYILSKKISILYS